MMKIVTHNGKIHADECAAISLLSNYFANKGIEVCVLRTRDPNKFLEADCLVDVGGLYDHSKLRYDHHQANFNETWSGHIATENSQVPIYNFGDSALFPSQLKEKEQNLQKRVPLSSAGLIWKHYGKEIVEMYLSNHSEQYDHAFNYTETTIEELLNIIYQKLILEIDANDNGIFIQGSIGICEIISAVNSNINDEDMQNVNFNRAVSLIGDIFDIKFKEIINSYFNFHHDLENLKKILTEEDKKKGYLILNENIPTVFKCLNEIDPDLNIRFCIFYNKDKEEYTIKARRSNGQKFLPLCPIIPENELNSLICQDVIFVHKASFLAKTRSLECAEKIVQLSLEYNQNLKSIEENKLDNVENKIQETGIKPINLFKENKILTSMALGSVVFFTYLYFSGSKKE